jgi:hypothetical protein
LLVIAAAELAAKGLSAAQIVSETNQLVPKVLSSMTRSNIFIKAADAQLLKC